MQIARNTNEWLQRAGACALGLGLGSRYRINLSLTMPVRKAPIFLPIESLVFALCSLRYELPQNSQKYEDGNKRLARACTSIRNNTFVDLANRWPGHHMIRAHQPHPIILFTLF